MTKEEQIALDAWREYEAKRIVNAEYYYPYDRTVAKHYETYRRLVRDDVRPPVVVDRVLQLWHDIDCPKPQAMKAIRTYGDERHAEGERAGIERALKWLDERFIHYPYDDMRRDLLGEPK